MQYSDVVSGDEGMKVFFKLGSDKDCMMGVLFMVFKNSNRSYPIRDLGGSIYGVSYRSGRKGWMDSGLFDDWLNEDCMFKQLP